MKRQMGRLMVAGLAVFGLAGVGFAQDLSIYDIQYVPDPDVDDDSPYYGGIYNVIGGVVTHIWSGFNDRVYAMTLFQGEPIAGGDFTASGGTALNRIARWDGLQWQPLGAGVDGADMVMGVAALRGTDGALYVGGDFDTAGGAPASALAYWDGAVWNEFAGGPLECPVAMARVDVLERLAVPIEDAHEQRREGLE